MSKGKALSDTFMTGSKIITDLGADVKRSIRSYSSSLGGNTIKTNLGKYALLPAATGGGIGLGLIGVGAGAGAGVENISKGLQKSFGLYDGNGDGTPDGGIVKTVSNISSWIVFILIGLAVVAVVKYATK